MKARELLTTLHERYKTAIGRVDIPNDRRLVVYVDGSIIVDVARFLFIDMKARYCVGIGIDDRDTSGGFLVAHDFAFDRENVLMSLMVALPAENPTVHSIAAVIPAAGWSEREMHDLLGIAVTNMPNAKRLVLPDGWPENLHPLRKDVPHNIRPADYDENKTYPFDPAPEGTTVVPFGPFHPTLDEPEHFRLYVEGELIRGCEYRGFMVHRGIEKLADSVMTYNEIPMLAERICGICGCVHSVAYAQAVELAAGVAPPPRAEYIRTIMLEIERLQSHLLWVGLANHLLGFDTLFMQAWRIREPVMWLSEKITGNRKTYSLCVIGGVRWDLDDTLIAELHAVLDRLEEEWKGVHGAVIGDKNIMGRAKGVGVTTEKLVREMGLLGPVARAAGVDIDVRRDHPYAAYDRVDFKVITAEGGDVWGRVVVRVLEVYESIRIIRQCLHQLPAGPIANEPTLPLPPLRVGFSSVEAPRGESHHFVVTGKENRPHRWRVRAPTYQNLQGIPEMIKDQRLTDMTITLGSIDPCFSCTDRMEIVDIRTGKMRLWNGAEIFDRSRPVKVISRGAT
jgi:Ni,Fe-hydrogenase III large subunit/Ni,Fe-hydrogenase III component G